MPTPKALLWQAYGPYEWSSTYYSETADNFTHANLDDITTAHGTLQANDISYLRWDVYDLAGNLIESYVPSQLAGSLTGQMQPIKYALYLRLDSSPSVQRPSSKYIHGWTEDLQSDGSFSSGGYTAVANYGNVLEGAAISDSEGNGVTSATFRQFSRRRKLRRAS